MMLGVGLVAALPPALLALAVFTTPYPWFAATVAVSCIGTGAVIGATVGRTLAMRPDPLGVLMVSAIAVAIGDLIAAPLLALEAGPVNLLDFWVGGLVVFGIPAFFFLSFPGVVIGIVLARRLIRGVSTR
jgi:hypothetical protein